MSGQDLCYLRSGSSQLQGEEVSKEEDPYFLVGLSQMQERLSIVNK